LTPDARSIATILADLAGDVRAIVRGELRLARAELGRNGLALRRVACLLAAAGGLAFLGLAYLFLSALFGLATVIPLWAAALLLGTLALVAAAVAGFIAMKILTGVAGFPRTFAALEETTRWPIQSKPWSTRSDVHVVHSRRTLSS
jgi:hypothetical protein